MKKIALALLIVMVMSSFTGCYWLEEVKANEVGVLMDDGVSVTDVVSSGRYTNMGFYANFELVDVQAKQVTWSDDSLWTADKQIIGFGVSVTYARNPDDVKMMWQKYNTAARDDKALEALVIARIPRVAKAVTSSRTLDSMLGREDLQEALKTQLAAEFLEIGVNLLDVGVNDITVDQAYADILSQKAAATIKSELAKEETKTRIELLAQEQAQTEIEIEKARRENLVAEELAKVYNTSPEMLQLELARIYGEALKNANTVYIPSDVNMNMFVTDNNGTATVVVPQGE